MPDINKQYAKTSYTLLVNAYGDKIPISEDEFYTKVQKDSDGMYRRTVYGLLRNAYGDKVPSDGDMFTSKFFAPGTDPYKKREEIRENSEEQDEFERAKFQYEQAQKGLPIEAAPDEYKKPKGKWWQKEYNVLSDKEIDKKYWEERYQTLNQEKQRKSADQLVVEKTSNLANQDLEKIKSGKSDKLIQEGYDPDVIQYVKTQDRFESRKQNILKLIDENKGDATLNLSLYNYQRNKDNMEDYNENLANAIDTSEFSKIRDYDKRVEYIQKESDEYVAQHKGKKVDEELRKDFYKLVSPYVLFDKDGTPSMFAVQNSAKITENQIDEEIRILENKSKELNTQKANDLRKERLKYDNINLEDPKVRLAFSDYHKNDDEIRQIQSEIKSLKLSKDVLGKAITKPLARGSRTQDFAQGVESTDWEDQLTLGVKSIIESIDMLKISQKYKEGKQLSIGEQSILDALGIMNYAAQKMPKSNYTADFYSIGEGVAQMPGYMVGFAIGSPIYNATKGAAKKVIGKVIKEKVVEEGAKGFARKSLGQWIAHRGIPGAIGTIPGTLANPSTSVLENTANRMTEVAEIALTDEVDELHSKFVAGSGEDFKTALRKGATEAYTENLFERSGTALLTGLGYPVKGLTKKIADTKLYQKLLIGEYAKLKGLNPKSLDFKNNITKVLETAGFNGMVEEMFEEYGTNIANGILNGEDMGLDLETFTTTLGTVAIWGSALGGLNKASYKILGNSVRATYKDLAGQEQSVKLPRKTYESLVELEKKEMVTSKDVQTLIEEGKLNGKQTSFVLKWQSIQMANSILKQVREDAKKKEEEKESTLTDTEQTNDKTKLSKEKDSKVAHKKEDDLVLERNEFDDISDFESIPEDEMTETLQENFKQTLSEVKEKYHDDTAMTEEMITFDQIGKGANITIQRKIGKEKINVPAEVTEVTNEYVKIKYKNGVEDIIDKDSEHKLFSNQKDNIDEETGKELLNDENKGKKGYIPFEIENNKIVYTKPIKDVGIDGEYSIFRNEDGTWDIIDEEGRIQEFEKPKNAKVQKNVVAAFKESKRAKSKAELTINKKLSEKKEGEIIYSTSGTGKTSLAKEQPDKYVDSDVLLAEEMKASINDFVISNETKAKIKKLDPNNLDDSFSDLIFELYREEKDMHQINWDKATMEDVYKKVAKKMQEKKAEGKTILTGSSKLINIADKIFTEKQDVVEGRKKKDLKAAVENEQKRIKKFAREKDVQELKGRSIKEAIEGKDVSKSEIKSSDIINIENERQKIKNNLKGLKIGGYTPSAYSEERVVGERIVLEVQDALNLVSGFIKKHSEEDIKNIEKVLMFFYKGLTKQQLKILESEYDNLKDSFEKIKKKFNNNTEKKFEVEEKTAMDKLESFAKLQIKNLEKTKEEKSKIIRSGTGITDQDVMIMFWRGVEKFAKGVKSLKELISKIQKWLAESTTYTPEQLQEIYNKIDDLLESRDEVIQQFKALFESEKPYYEVSDSITVSAEEKLAAHRKAFSVIFKNTSEKTSQDKRKLEKEFFLIVRSGMFDKMTNEKDYLNALKKAKEDYPKYKELFDEIELHWDYNRAISLFNFYRNVRLVEQRGIIISKDGIKIKSLNSEDYTNDLGKKFNYHINNITARTTDDKMIDDPNAAIVYHLNEYRNKLVEIKTKNNTNPKIVKFEAQLDFLNKITGIGKDIWEGYFVPKTNETEVFLKKEDDNGNEIYEKVIFDNYRSLLNFDHAALNENGNHAGQGIIHQGNTKGKYIDSEIYYFDKSTSQYKVKNNPAIINSLTKAIDLSLRKNAKQTVIDFFTKDNEEKEVYSNLKKLASTIQKQENISIDGYDIQGNRFNSFVMISDFQHTAENLHKSPLTNTVAKMYQAKGEPMKIEILNGIDSKKTEKQSLAYNLTEQEYWLTQMILFQQAEGGEYKGVLGQFGDKKQMLVASVKLYEEPNMKEIETKFKDLEKVRSMFRKIMVSGIKIGAFKKYDEKFIDKFIYNFVKNIEDVHEIFHGQLIKENYKDLVDLVKRGASTISTGYRLDQSVEGGVGNKFRFVSAIDNTAFADKLGLSEEQFDGILFYSGKMGDKIATSMGTLYNKTDEYIGPLSSTKALFSTRKKGKRGLTKTNWVNIDVIADAYKDQPDHYSHKIKALLDREYTNEKGEKYSLDSISFKSGTKKLESKSHLTLFDKDGGFIDITDDDMNNHSFDRNTSDIYVQQELRHSVEPDKGKQSTQLMANILVLQHAPEMIAQMNEQTSQTLKSLSKKLSEIDNTKDKIDFLKEYLKTRTEDEMTELLNLNATLFEIGYKNRMTSMIASNLEKKGLEKMANRTATQELPADHTLKGYRKSANGKHILLPQIDTGIEGIRYDQKFESQDKALAEYKKNKDKYEDVEEWEIEDGIIPGELVLSTRIPADDLHSHTLGRARLKLNGNFTVLDKESQARSGSDYDGDQRFNQTAFKDKNGKTIKNGVQGNANEFLKLLKQDYHNPENLERILNAINTKFFDSIIDKKNIKYNFADPDGLNDSRKNNLIGLVMKGILSDLSVMSALIVNHNIGLKEKIDINKARGLSITEFAKDKDGSLRNAIGILQNLAFDNAKDPKIEAMGLNEITAPMFILLMISDPSIDSAENKTDWILNKVKNISEYFNSEILTDFIRMKREANGVLVDMSDKNIFAHLSEKYGKFDAIKLRHISPLVEKFKQLYYASRDFNELKKYYSMTKSFPQNVVELLDLINNIDYFENNTLKLFDVSELKDSNIKTFELINETIKFATERIFNHTIELSVAGQEIFKQFVKEKAKKFDGRKGTILYEKEIEAISRTLNLVVAIDAVNDSMGWDKGKRMGFKEFEKNLYEKIDGYRSRYPDNKFLNAIQRSGAKDNYTIKIADTYNLSNLPENELIEIRKDFDKLDDYMKKNFSLYSLQKYGLGTSTFRGNFFSLFSLEYRAELSRLIENEVDKWQNGFVDKPKIDNTIEWIKQLNPDVFSFAEKVSIKGAEKGIYDTNINPAFEPTNEALKELFDVLTSEIQGTQEEVKQIKTKKVVEILQREGLTKESFDRYRTIAFKEKKLGARDFIKDMIEQREKQFLLEKPVDLYNLVKKYLPCKFN